MRKGAIILCGGQSTRMGRDKATLPFGSESMLQRVVRLMSEVVDVTCIVVVAAPDQMLPGLPSSVVVVRDERPGRGPMEGLAAGFRAIADRVDAAYASSCDVPLLAPAFVEQMFAMLGDNDIAVPRDGEHFHPLAAVYRPSVLDAIDRFLAEDQLRIRLLFAKAKTREIPVADLRLADPDLSTLLNLNQPRDYLHALSVAGLPMPAGISIDDTSIQE